jgi:hypothetical protein
MGSLKITIGIAIKSSGFAARAATSILSGGPLDRGLNEGFADEETADAAGEGFPDIGFVVDAAGGDDGGAARQQGGDARRAVDVGLEMGENRGY